MSDAPPAPHWHVVRAKPKAEHLAAARLGGLSGVEAYCPRIRFEKTTRRGRIWFVEALFPGYFFARFDRGTSLRAVQASPQVTGVVHFGEDYPALDGETIEQLRGEFPDTEPRIVANQTEPQAGDTVEIMSGALAGWTALVTRALPGSERVRLLLEWLGQMREVEVAARSVVRRNAG